jgi:hypothetical protein
VLHAADAAARRWKKVGLLNDEIMLDVLLELLQ